MRLCPLGHENSDDATRCVVCLRRLDPEPVTLQLHLSGGSPALRAGTTTTVALVLTQAGGEPMTGEVAVAGPVAAWVADRPATVTSQPGSEVPVVLELQVPASAPATAEVLGVEVRAAGAEGTSAALEVPVRVIPSPQPTQPVVIPAPDPGRAHPPWARRPRRAARSAPPTTPQQQPETVAVPRRQRSPGRGARPSARGQPPRKQPAGAGRTARQPPPRLPVGWLVAVAVVVGLGAAALWFAFGRGLGPQEAFELSRPAAAETLVEIATEDQTEVASFLDTEAVALQLSSKCPELGRADLFGPGGLGDPDGTAEDYPQGVGENGILAFHLGLRENFGPEGILLATGTELGERGCESGAPRWLTLHAPPDGLHGSIESALCECASRGLPSGECAARRAGGPVVFFFQENVPPAAACRDAGLSQ